MPLKEVAAIYNVPKPRQEWIKGKFVQRHEKNEEAWVELFVDLIYVVLLSKLGDIIHVCNMTEALQWKVAVIFSIMCLTRQAIDEYANRFYSHDLMHKLIYLVYASGLFIQVLNIDAVYDTPSSSAEVASHSESQSNAPLAPFAATSSTSNSHAYDCLYIPEFELGMIVGVIITRASIIASKFSLSLDMLRLDLTLPYLPSQFMF